MTIIDQMELDLAAPPDETRLQRTARRAEPDWWDAAMAAVARLAKTGKPFDAYALTLAGVPAPDHANRWGALFNQARRRGIIEHAGYHQSARPGRAHGVCSLWRGIQGADDIGVPTDTTTDHTGNHYKDAA